MNITETDPVTLERRQKQIDYGKNTDAYKTYIKCVPKESRHRTFPRTPEKGTYYSRRQWDGLVKAWKLQIHQWNQNGSGKKISKKQDPPVVVPQDKSLDMLIQLVISSDLPYSPKIRMISSIESKLINVTRHGFKKSSGILPNYILLLQEEFLNQLGKLLEITIENPYSFNDAQMVLRVIEKIISFGPEAKTLVETCCSESLQKLGSKFNVVKKANEILQPTLI